MIRGIVASLALALFAALFWPDGSSSHRLTEARAEDRAHAAARYVASRSGWPSYSIRSCQRRSVHSFYCFARYRYEARPADDVPARTCIQVIRVAYPTRRSTRLRVTYPTSPECTTTTANP